MPGTDQTRPVPSALTRGALIGSWFADFIRAAVVHRLHQQAEYMTAPDQLAIKEENPCAPESVHTWNWTASNAAAREAWSYSNW
jgi:hypothetical protein